MFINNTKFTINITDKTRVNTSTNSIRAIRRSINEQDEKKETLEKEKKKTTIS